MTALVVYGSSIAATTVSTSDKLSTTTGGVETTKAITSPNNGANSEWMEILSQGGTATGSTGSIPAPTGKGYLLDATTLEAQTIATGNWTPIVNLSIAATVISSFSATIRFYKRSSGGVYTSIGSITKSAISVTGAKQQISFTATSFSSMAFSTGDKLYIDVWLQSGSGANIWSADAITFYVSNSGTAGVANDMQITTPGYAGAHVFIFDGLGGMIK